MSRVNKRFNYLSRDPLLYKCLNLRNIHLTYMHTNICQLFDYFAPRCKRILQLDLAYCKYYAPYFREFLETCCRHLTHLRLSHCRYVFYSGLLGDISELCKNLKELDLNYCKDIRHKNISHLKNLQFLERLHLENIFLLESNTLCEILQKNRQMRDLNLANTRLNIDTAVVIELKNCLNLERLNLMRCSITSQEIYALADCKNLIEINFSGCRIKDYCDRSGAFSRLFSSCKRLTKVDLSYSDQYKPLNKRDLETLALCKNLKSLNLMSLDSVTPAICSQLFTKCTKLNEIDLTFCKNISQNLVDQWNEIYNEIIVYKFSHRQPR
ncbi:PREDICTED: F-box/LRR-repeat protein 2-like [Wasmannia auropunctata]|uniref:F-box/LRR-repeat protein 2-like n=1 Tax=Wasmannia auropunctata TaxID=64793 RepID=UPI0005F0BF0B|nr:PREDICTED: F-box/LRR-repeat protein 2-like [Wasmannia auropunctata]